MLVVDDRDRLLLFHDTDLGLGTQMWITAGGGLEPGESEVEAAVRELEEETGLVVDAAEVWGPIARRVVVHGFSDKVVEQTEVYFGVRTGAFEVDVTGHTAEEQLAMTAHRWWTRDELEASSDEVWPRSVARLWQRFDQGLPEIDLGTSEESTVPADR